jgi:hypothetical protein
MLPVLLQVKRVDDDDNAPLTPSLPRELRNLETFYNPKPGDQGNIALLTQSHDVIEGEMLAYPYKELLKTLRPLVMMLSLVRLIYLNIEIPNLLLKLC